MSRLEENLLFKSAIGLFLCIVYVLAFIPPAGVYIFLHSYRHVSDCEWTERQQLSVKLK